MKKILFAMRWVTLFPISILFGIISSKIMTFFITFIGKLIFDTIPIWLHFVYNNIIVLISTATYLIIGVLIAPDKKSITLKILTIIAIIFLILEILFGNALIIYGEIPNNMFALKIIILKSFLILSNTVFMVLAFLLISEYFVNKQN